MVSIVCQVLLYSEACPYFSHTRYNGEEDSYANKTQQKKQTKKRCHLGWEVTQMSERASISGA